MRIPFFSLLRIPFAVLALAIGGGCGTSSGNVASPADLGRAHRDLARGQLERAGEAYRRVAENAGADARSRAVAQANLGVVLMREGKFPEAVEALSRAVELAPAEPLREKARMHFNLALALREGGRHKKAEASYLEAARLDPSDLDIQYNLGILYELYLNQPRLALEAYSRYVAGGGALAGRVTGWMGALQGRDGAE